jgi:KRAB domain-containing zinc finger protein
MAPFLPCDQCGRDLNSLERRMKSQHIKSHLFDIRECGDCGKEFMNERNLKLHKNKVHGGQVFNCVKCGVEFKDKYNFNRHMASMHEDLGYQCEKCLKDFKWKGSFQRHIEKFQQEIIQKEEVNCDRCEAVLSNSQTLKSHINKVHDNKYSKKCRFPSCKKTFSDSYNEKRHVGNVHKLVLSTIHNEAPDEKVPNVVEEEIQNVVEEEIVEKN